MEKKFFTVLFVPQAGGKTRRVRLSRNFLAFCAAFLLLAGVGAMTLIHYSVSAFQRSTEFTLAEAERDQFAAENSRYRSLVVKLRDQLGYFERKTSQFALMAGVSEEVEVPAAGGTFDESDALTDADLTELRTLLEKSDLLKRKYTSLERAMADKTLLLASTPSIWPTRGIPTDGYRWRKDPFTGKRAFHRGLDVSARTGTPVLATGDGVVTSARRNGGHGNQVVIKHGFGLETRYGHLSKFNVRSGKKVKRGDVIGFVGQTGRATGPHLHYEVVVNDKHVNPVAYILEDLPGRN